MTFAAAGRAATLEADSAIIGQIVEILEARRGSRSYKELAAEIGVSRTMLRTIHLYGVAPGADTLAMLLDWEPETFTTLVLDYLRHRGSLLRSKTTRLT